MPNGSDYSYDISGHPRLGYEVIDPVMGIGTLSMSDLEHDAMGVMLQGKVAELEIRKLRRRIAELEAAAAVPASTPAATPANPGFVLNMTLRRDAQSTTPLGVMGPFATSEAAVAEGARLERKRRADGRITTFVQPFFAPGAAMDAPKP